MTLYTRRETIGWLARILAFCGFGQTATSQQEPKKPEPVIYADEFGNILITAGALKAGQIVRITVHGSYTMEHLL